MDDKDFRKRADAIYRAVIARLDDEDPDEIEAEPAEGVVRIKLRGGKVFVLNHQAPLREIWYAAGDRAWQFQFDPSTSRWVDPRNFDELGAVINATLSRAAGRPIAVPLG